MPFVYGRSGSDGRRRDVGGEYSEDAGDDERGLGREMMVEVWDSGEPNWEELSAGLQHRGEGGDTKSRGVMGIGVRGSIGVRCCSGVTGVTGVGGRRGVWGDNRDRGDCL